MKTKLILRCLLLLTLYFLSTYKTYTNLDYIIKPIRNTNPNYINSINVEWNYIDSTPPLHYRIRVTDINDNELFTLNTEDNYDLLIEKNIMNVSGLTLGEYYKFYVSSYDDQGNYSTESSPLIAQECVKPIYQINQTNPNIVATVISEDEITVMFDPPDYLGGCDIEKYILYYSDGDSNDLVNELVIYDLNTHQTTITIADYINNQGKIFTFQIEAYNPAASAKTEALSIILGRTPIDQPSIIQINESETTSSSICLILPELNSSTYNSGGLPIISYEILIDISNNNVDSNTSISWIAFHGSPPNYSTDLSVCLNNNTTITNIDTTTTDIYFNLGRIYSFKYRVWNVLGFSDYSAKTDYFISIVPETPSPPILVTQSATQFIFELNSSFKYTGLIVTTKLFGTIGPSDAEAEIVAFNNYSFSFILDKSTYSLTNNKLYYFRLKSSNNKGDSDFSDYLTIRALTNFSQITSISILNLYQSYLKLKWEVSFLDYTNIIGYNIYIDNKGNEEFTKIATKGNEDDTTLNFVVSEYNDTHTNDIAFVLGENYNIKIETIGLDGLSISKIELFKFCEPVEIFNSLVVVEISSSNLLLNWNNPEEKGGCEMEKFVLTKNQDIAGTITTTELELPGYQFYYSETYIAADLGKNFSFSIMAFNALFSDSSNTVNVIVKDQIISTLPTPTPITTSYVPDKPSVVNIIEENFKPKIKFLLSNHNNSIITEIEFKIQNNVGDFIMLTECNVNSLILSQRYCTFNYDILKIAPYYLDVEPIIVIIRFKNGVGYSEWSDPNTISETTYVKYPPRTPLPNIIVDSQLADLLNISVPEPMDDDTVSGKSEITNITVDYKKNSDSSFTNLAGETTDNINRSFSLTGLDIGSSYDFKYKLKNYFGESDYSDIVTFPIQNIPDDVAITNISFDSATKLVDINWNNSLYDGNASITQYRVFFLLKDLDNTKIINYSQVGVGCNDSTVLTSLACSFDITQLDTTTPFNYEAGDLITVTVLAINEKGSSNINIYSSFEMINVPTKPSSLTRGVNTSSSQLELIFPNLPTIKADYGNLTLITYKLELQTAGSSFTVVKGSEVLPFLTTTIIYNTSITASEEYTFRIALQNDLGISEYSDLFKIKAAGLPLKMSPGIVSINTVTPDSLVYFTWSAADFNGDDINTNNGYVLLIQNIDNDLIEHYDCLDLDYNTLSCYVELTTLLEGEFNLVPNYPLKVYIKAKNSFGESIISDEFENNQGVISASVPLKPGEVITSVSSTNVVFTVSPDSDKGAFFLNLIKIKLFIKNNSGDFIEAVNCDETILLENLLCSIPMSDMIEVYSLTQGDLIVAKSSSVNIVGESELSDANTTGIDVRIKPFKPTNLVYLDDTVSSKYQLKIIAPEITDWTLKGNSDLTSYNVEWDQGNGGSFVNLYGMYPPELRRTDLRIGLNKGKAFKYRYRVSNIYGWSDYSDISTIYTGTKPDIPEYITTENTDYTYVTVSWYLKNLSGLDIVRYQIVFLDSSSNEVEVLDYCNGQNMMIILNQSCVIPISQLNSLLSLDTGETIYAKVRAYNIKGWSDYTGYNIDGAVMYNIPEKPLYSPEVIERNDTEITIKALEITDFILIGGLKIISYNIQWDQSIDEYVSLTGEDYNSLVRQITTSSLLAGRIYKYKYRVKNLLGWSEFSDEIAIESSTKPDPINSLSTSNVNEKVVINFVEPYNRGKEITNYSFYIKLKNGSLSNITCDEDLTTIISTLTCSFDMMILKNYPFSFVYGDEIVAFITSYNGNGWSEYSNPSNPNAKMLQKPLKPPKPITSKGSYSRVEIKLTDKDYEPINGGSTISSYHLVCDRIKIDISTETVTATETNYLDLILTVVDSIYGIDITDNTNGFRYNFECKYTITNAFGTSDYSDKGIIEAGSVPSKMNSITSVNDEGDIIINYVIGDENGGKITSVVVEVKDIDDFLRPAYTTSDTSLTSCIISNYVLLDEPFSLKEGYYVYGTVYAINKYGYSERSDINTQAFAAIIGRRPPTPIIAPFRGDNTNEIMLEILITAIEDIMFPVLQYIIEIYDEVNANWNVLFENSLDTTNYWSSYDITSATWYSFRYKAKNKFGDSLYSPIGKIQAATFPSKMEPPRTKYSLFNPTYVEIELTEPNNRGAEIDLIELEVLNYDNDYIYVDNCQNTLCEIPISYFYDDLFNLKLGNFLLFRARTSNIYGYSEYSANSIPLIVKTVPLKPYYAPYKGENTTLEQIHVKIKELNEYFSGYDEIIAYEIVIINEDESLIILNLGLYLEAYYYDIYEDTIYNFSYRAKNSLGWGPYSDFTSIKSLSTVIIKDEDEEEPEPEEEEDLSEYNYVPTTGPSTSFSYLEIILENTNPSLPETEDDSGVIDYYHLHCNRHRINIETESVVLIEENKIDKILHYPFLRYNYSLDNPGPLYRYDFVCWNESVSKQGNVLASTKKIIKAGQPPSEVSNISFNYIAQYLSITYDLPVYNGSLLDFIDVYLRSKSGKYYRICHYTSENIQSECLISGFLLIDSPFNLSSSDIINVYVVSSNDFGMSKITFSEENTYVQYLPKDPVLPPTENKLSGDNQIIINIPAVLHDVTYNVYYSKDNIGFNLLSTGYPDLTYALSEYSMKLGDIYYFKYKTVNAFGESRNYSPVSSIVISAVPKRMDPPKVSYEEEFPGKIRIEIFNNDNNGLDIKGYKVKIKSAYGDYVDFKWCSEYGVNSSLLNSNLNNNNSLITSMTVCYFPVYAFYDSPLYLKPGDNIIVISSNYNEHGYSQFSSDSEAIELKSVPIAPKFPPYSTENTSNFQIALKISDLSMEDTDNENVLSYNVVVILGKYNFISLAGGDEQTKFTDTSKEIIYTDVVPGNTYMFRYRAKTIFGWGAYSDIGYIRVPTS